jgi:hypothetical protein
MRSFKNLTELFDYVWETREHISELSGKPLFPKGHSKWHWQMAHLLGKSYSHYKFNPDNIILALPEEHERQETFPKFIERRDELKRQYYDEFYNNIKQIL